MRIFCEVDEAQKHYLDEIGSPRFKKAVEGHSQEFINGAMWGISWAGCMLSEISQYFEEDERETI